MLRLVMLLVTTLLILTTHPTSTRADDDPDEDWSGYFTLSEVFGTQDLAEPDLAEGSADELAAMGVPDDPGMAAGWYTLGGDLFPPDRLTDDVDVGGMHARPYDAAIHGTGGDARVTLMQVMHILPDDPVDGPGTGTATVSWTLVPNRLIGSLVSFWGTLTVYAYDTRTGALDVVDRQLIRLIFIPHRFSYWRSYPGLRGIPVGTTLVARLEGTGWGLGRAGFVFYSVPGVTDEMMIR